MLKTAEFPTKFIVSPPKHSSNVEDMPHLSLFNPVPNEIVPDRLPPSVILRGQEEEKHKQASQKGSRKRDILPSVNGNSTNSFSNISH